MKINIFEYFKNLKNKKMFKNIIIGIIILFIVYFIIMVLVSNISHYSFIDIINITRNVKINYSYFKTDSEREIHLERGITELMKISIESLDGVEKAYVTIAWTYDDHGDYNASASVIIFPFHESDINKKMIDSILHLLNIIGIKDEDIIIINKEGDILN